MGSILISAIVALGVLVLALFGTTFWWAWARGGLLDALHRAWQDLGDPSLRNPRELRWNRAILRYAEDLPVDAQTREIVQWRARFRKSARVHTLLWVVLLIVPNSVALVLILLSD